MNFLSHKYRKENILSGALYILYETIAFIFIVLEIHCCIMVLSHDVASGSDIMPCNKINKILVVYRFRNVA